MVVIVCLQEVLKVKKKQYEHLKESELKRGASDEDVEQIAAAITNKTKKEKDETKS